MTFSLNSTSIPTNELTTHLCENNERCDSTNNFNKILPVQNIRYLGITFDRHLRWNLQYIL